VTEVDLPAVLTSQTGIHDPRNAILRGIRQAQSKEMEMKPLEDIELDASVVNSALEQTALYEPEAEGEAEIIEGDAETTAGEFAGILREKGVDE